eukprot:817157-Prymnesium_polylepis.1
MPEDGSVRVTVRPQPFCLRSTSFDPYHLSSKNAWLHQSQVCDASATCCYRGVATAPPPDWHPLLLRSRSAPWRTRRLRRVPRSRCAQRARPSPRACACLSG